MNSETHAAAATEPAGHGQEDDVVADARGRAAELRCAAIGPQTGTTLRFLACALRARAVVEIGTGAGVSGLHLLRGMPSEGVLTSIDIEAECQRQARRGFADAGFAPSRTRLITGQALEVLPRFTAGGYDLVFVDAAQVEYTHYYEQGIPLLRTGGVIAFHDRQAHHAQESVTDADAHAGARAMRELAGAVRHDERLTVTALPRDTGLLLASLAWSGH